MGQHSSKRGSYTPSKDVSNEDSISPRSRSSINGSVEVLHSPGSASGGVDPLEVSLRSTPGSGSAGKKDKTKRFKVPSFSVGRTPSGRWTRKKRPTSKARPVSMPIYLNDEAEETPSSRPQSLYMDELDVTEEDKIETVDLSDD
ncbi:neuroblast differentiation-associated protein AHNAK-like isoform X1, partial [Biomphalaria pfeifferi]